MLLVPSSASSLSIWTSDPLMILCASVRFCAFLCVSVRFCAFGIDLQANDKLEFRLGNATTGSFSVPQPLDLSQSGRSRVAL